MSTEFLATEATLHTVQVTIQALLVRGKQMTIAVFKQLPIFEGSLIDSGTLTWRMLAKTPIGDIDKIPIDRIPTGRIMEINIWGVVNYSIKNEGTKWLVVENGGRLFRKEFPEKPEIMENFKRLFNKICEDVEKREAHCIKLDKAIEKDKKAWFPGVEWQESLKDEIVAERERIRDLTNKLEWITEHLQEINTANDTAFESWHSLDKLPQLFIAA